MKFQAAINIWSLDKVERGKLKRGQWVYAGNPEDKGIWCGRRPSGSDVVAWYHNAKNRGSFWGYVQTLFSYAKGD